MLILLPFLRWCQRPRQEKRAMYWIMFGVVLAYPTKVGHQFREADTNEVYDGRFHWLLDALSVSNENSVFWIPSYQTQDTVRWWRQILSAPIATDLIRHCRIHCPTVDWDHNWDRDTKRRVLVCGHPDAKKEILSWSHSSLTLHDSFDKARSLSLLLWLKNRT